MTPAPDRALTASYLASYASLGWRVFPVHPIVDGRCGCGTAGCKDPGKHPAIQGWTRLATSDRAQIAEWWRRYPDAGIGIATGKGLLVLDVDVKPGKVGEASMAAVVQRHGPLPPTYTVRTGSGGWHLYFAYDASSGAYLRKSLGTLAKDLDVMAEGGFVVAPPSPHISGRAYAPAAAAPVPLAPLPAFIQEHALRAAPPRTVAVPTRTYPPADEALLAAARLRLMSHGPAVQGSAGDQHTVQAAMILVNDFALTPEEAWPLIWEWNRTCQPPWGDDDLARKLRNGAAYASGEYGRERDAAAAVAAMRAGMAASGTRAFREQNTREGVAWAGYTPENIAAFAAEHRCSVTEWQRRWIIQHGSSYWYFCAGRYIGPWPERSAHIAAKRYLAPAPIKWVVYGEKKDRPKTLAELVDEYGSPALHLESHLGLQRSWFEPHGPKGAVFHEAVCPIREDLVPVFNPAIDHWLRLIGGPDAEALLDWVATITVLDRPSCALYIKSEKGIGKGMLADGLARIWAKEGGPTALARALGNFNELIARVPLIWGDEKIPKKIEGAQGVSGQLRSLIAESNRPLNRKHISHSMLGDCIRLLLTANNEHMLEDPSERDLTPDDIAAIAERYLFIDAKERSQALREFLASIGGRAGTEAWVKGDGIACHALWLRQNRAVTYGDRFIVAGKPTAMHEDLATSFGIMDDLCRWLCAFLENPAKIMPQASNGIFLGNGVLLASARTICDHWLQYLRKEPSSETLVGRRLKDLSVGQRKVRVGGGPQRRFHQIDAQKLLDFAHRRDLGDVEAMRARISAVCSNWTWEAET